MPVNWTVEYTFNFEYFVQSRQQISQVAVEDLIAPLRFPPTQPGEQSRFHTPLRKTCLLALLLQLQHSGFWTDARFSFLVCLLMDRVAWFGWTSARRCKRPDAVNMLLLQVHKWLPRGEMYWKIPGQSTFTSFWAASNSWGVFSNTSLLSAVYSYSI